MTSLTAKTFAKTYLIIVLLLAVLVSPPTQLGIALVLLVIQLYAAYKPLKASLNLVLVVSSLVFVPLALEALAGQVYSVLLMVPAMLLLDQGLRDNASAQVFVFAKTGRGITSVLKGLGAGLLLVFLASVVVWNVTLMLTAAVLIGYLAVMLAYVFRKVPKTPLQEARTWSRIVAGDTDTLTVNLRAKVGTPVFVSLQPADSWVHVEPSNFSLPAQGEMDTHLRFSPPLAGPSKIRLQACVVDSRGIFQMGQVLEPVDLHIIPRAKYAQWLANKYLEQTASGTGAAAAVPPLRSLTARRGVEYHGSRPYQPGDRYKDVDWKHSYLLGELIVKEFSGAHGQPAIIVADFTARDAEDADRLAHDFVMSALTLAIEALPAALAVFNRKEVLAAIPSMNPRETLKKVLELTQRIMIVEPKEKVLQPTQMRRLRRSMGQLEQMNTESAQKLKGLLEVEFAANQEAARLHPATVALAKAVLGTQAPAVITVASSLGYDSDALLMALERLKEKGYSTVIVGAERKKH